MPVKSKLPSREELVRLHDEEGKSWREIANMFGVSYDHVQRTARHGSNYMMRSLAKRPVVEVDPREYLPDLKDCITDEMIAKWRETKTCLCGCGEPVTLRVVDTVSGPRGSYTYFRIGHVNRFEPYNARLRSYKWTPEARRKLSVAIHKGLIKTDMLAYILEEYKNKRGLTYKKMAEEIGMDDFSLGEIIRGVQKYIRPKTAVRVMLNMNEPIPRSLWSYLTPEQRRAERKREKEFDKMYGEDVA